MLYSIEIHGNGAEAGIHKVTKAQYDFWTNPENQQYLKEALFEDYSSVGNDLPDEIYFPYEYSSLCDVLYYGGGYLGGLMIEITPIEFDNEEDAEDESIYSYDDELNEFIESLSKTQYNQIVEVEEFEFPAKKGKTAGYLMWKIEESGMFLHGEIDVGKKFDLKKLRLNFMKVNEDIFLTSVTYDDYQLERTDNWEAGEMTDAEIIKAQLYK